MTTPTATVFKGFMFTETAMKSLSDLIENALATMVKPRKVPLEKADDYRNFLVGHAATTHQPVHLTWRDRRKHVYALGSSGCGKSNLLVRLIGDDLAKGRNAVVVDLRGDLVDRLVRRMTPEELKYGRVHLLDFRPSDTAVPFNPLTGAGSPYRRALHLLEVIHQGAPSWGVQLDETLRFSLVALAEAGGSLLDVELLLTDPVARAELLKRCSDEQVKRFFTRFDRLSSERQAAWALPVLNKLSHLWSVPQVRTTLSSPNSIDWRGWIDEPGHLILVALAAHKSPGVANTIGGLIVASLQDAVMSRADADEAKRVPLTLYLDEFETMATPTFNTILAEGRRFGLSLFLAHQNLSQLESSLRHSIRANVQTSLIFQCSTADAADLSSDILSGIPREKLRTAIATQAVGGAFLIRRAQSSVRLQTVHSPDPPIDSMDLEQRLASIRVCQAEVRNTAVGPTATEVRHERRPYLP